MGAKPIGTFLGRMLRVAKKALWLIGLLFLGVSAGANAAVDKWVLAMTWHPAYCARNRGSAECGEGHASGLVLHGLWPENDAGSVEFCAATPSLQKRDTERQWCRLPALNLEAKASEALDKAMPGRAACLDRHEWYRHGICSGMNADRYFTAAAGVVERINGLEIGRFLKENMGKEVRTVDLVRAALHETGLEGRPAFSFICLNRGREAYLTEVWIAMSYLGPWLFPQPATLRSQSSPVGHLCPERGTILIDGAP
jgi:ribonuclease I